MLAAARSLQRACPILPQKGKNWQAPGSLQCRIGYLNPALRRFTTATFLPSAPLRVIRTAAQAVTRLARRPEENRHLAYRLISFWAWHFWSVNNLATPLL